MSEYAGYRIQINGEIFPNSMIARGTYSVTPAVRRIASEITNANGKRKVIYYPHKGVQIDFNIIKRTFEKQNVIARFFESDDGVYDLVYWDDIKQQYQTGDFILSSNLTFQHKNTRKKSMYYEETQISFERL